MNEKKRREIFKRFERANPAPTTELSYRSTFELLIAVILSAQATDKSVNLATAKLFPIANTPEKILALGLRGLKRYVRTIGLYNSKAANIMKTCRLLLEEDADRYVALAMQEARSGRVETVKLLSSPLAGGADGVGV